MSTTAVARPAVLTPIDLAAWGTQVRVVVTDPLAASTAEACTRSWLDVVDRACSRFRDDSELIAVNRAAGRPVAVGEVLVAALTAAVDAARSTDGLVTPTVGAAICAAGYDRTFALVGTTDPGDLPRAVPDLAGPEPAPDWRAIAIDAAAGTVQVEPGCLLDLGSTTKAWAADQLAAQLADVLSCGVLVDLGGDVVVAGPAPDDGWLVRVVDGPRDRGVGPVVTLTDGALATSSTVVRRWVADGRPRHHIIDPRTGAPADDLWRTVTVHAARCFDANVVSTAAVVLGEQALSWLAEVELPARLVARDGSVTTVNDWPADPIEGAA